MSLLIHNHNLNGEGVALEPVNDFIGFSFNGVHSSNLGIKRTSEGSRFNENLLPTIQDKTVQVPGGDGMYFFGSYYTQRQFNISYAFDALTEEQLARIKAVFGDKKIHDLIFDETPYKVYKAKVTGSASIKHIPFAEGETNRIYKGEGTIQFTAYEPFARSAHKYANEYDVNNYAEWKDAANLLATQGNYDTIINTNKINLYNPGDRESDFILTFNFSNGIIPKGAITITEKDGTIHQLLFNQITAQGNDNQIKINSRLNLIEGYYQGRKSGNVYNRYITDGAFFKIPLTVDTLNPLQLVIDNANKLPDQFSSIEYDYYYF